MASSKKSSTKAKSKEAGTSKPAPQTNNHDSKKKKEKISSNKHANNASAKAISDPGSASDDADELRAETTSKRAKASNSKIVKRNHGKKAVNGYAEEEEEGEEVVAEEKISKFPMHRIKKIMKDENSDLRINQEALFIVNKATEMFLLQFCKDAYACCAQDRKKSLAYKHLSSVVYKRKRYDFLSDFVPEKLKFEDALKERSTEEPEKD